MTPEVKGKLLRTAGLGLLGVGVYLLILSERYDPNSNTKPPGDIIIDAVWSEVE